MEATTADGRTLYVDREQTVRGSKGPFFVVYTDEHAERRWGYLCGNCETVDNAMDAMGRLKCNRCANIKKPDEWDAAHEWVALPTKNAHDTDVIRSVR